MNKLIFIFVILGALTLHAQEANAYSPENNQVYSTTSANNNVPMQQNDAPAPQNAYGQPQPNGYAQPQQNGYAPAPQYGYGAPQPNGYAQPQPNGHAQPQPNGYAPAPQYGYAQPAPYQPINPNAFDSTAYYQNLVNTYTKSGTSKRNAGIGMMIGGAASIAVGLAMMVSSANELEDECSAAGEFCDHDPPPLFVAGELIAIGGGAILGVGIAFKIVGGSKLRKAERAQQQLNTYQARKAQSFSIRLEPQLDIINRNYGGKLALNF